MEFIDKETGEIIRADSVEQAELAKHEETIERGLNTFVEVGQALLVIRDKRLYRATHSTFEDYCRERWGMSRPRAYELIGAAETIENLSGMTDILPANARQATALAGLNPNDQRTVWQAAVETTPANGLTAAHVQQTANEFVSKQKPKINRAGDKYTPQGHDACQTPPYAVDPLLPYLNPQWTIWEPASGEGYIVDALFDSGFDHIEISDLIHGQSQNFFEYEPAHWDCLVTNPPYSIKYEWIARCYQLGKPFALLMPVETLGAQGGQDWFREHGVQVIFLDKRVNFKMPNKGWEGSAQFPTAWFTWGLSLPSDMVFARINRDGSAD